MATRQAQGCPHCERLQAQVQLLQAQVEQLQGDLAKARKNSRTSSKPPSSDITNPPKKKKPATKKKRKRGGQKGHPRHLRQPFTPDDIDHVLEYRVEQCPCCGGGLQDVDLPPKVQQHVELQELPVTITEHHRVARQCQNCQQVHYSPFPQELIKAGLIGPRLTALIGFLKGACHMSFSSIRKFFRDVIGIGVSRGLLSKLVYKVSDSLQDPYEELLRLLPEEDILNVDETGHKDNGGRLWTWCFRASLFTLFKISPSRGSQVLVEVLGKEFDGILGCDYFSAYRKYMKDFDVRVQFCLAHFIRDVKFLAEHPNTANRDYGERLLTYLRKLFGIIHRREQYASAATFRQALEKVMAALVWEATMESPHTDEALNLEERFYQHTESYFRFITTPGVEPTNNLAEQAIRFVAIHRRLTQGTRGEQGQSWCERLWTILTTCEQQGRSLFEFLCEAVTSSFRGEAAPSLAPDSS